LPVFNYYSFLYNPLNFKNLTGCYEQNGDPAWQKALTSLQVNIKAVKTLNAQQGTGLTTGFPDGITAYPSIK